MSKNPFEEINERLDRIDQKLDNLKTAPIQPEQPDLCDLTEASIILDRSDAFIYGETSKGTMPFKKFGSRLVFSRRELLAWREARTGDPKFPATLINDRIVASAEKKLR